jgi:hypothetical protein
MPIIKQEWVKRSYHEYVRKWLWDEWGYARGWTVQLPAMFVWYAKEDHIGQTLGRRTAMQCESVAASFALYLPASAWLPRMHVA